MHPRQRKTALGTAAIAQLLLVKLLPVPASSARDQSCSRWTSEAASQSVLLTLKTQQEHNLHWEVR